MDTKTRHALGEINDRFYRHQADAFSNTRSAPWGGWSRVVEALGEHRAYSPESESESAGRLGVLDAACGNGRFGTLLQQKWEGSLFYWGIDASPQLLETARDRLKDLQELRLSPWNLLAEDPQEPWLQERFSLIAVFGLLHHVPSVDLRLRMLKKFAQCLQPGGILALSVWRFGMDERFQRRILPWEEYNQQAETAIAVDQLEKGDVLLRWGNEPGVVRYCHAVSEAEQEAWEGQLGLNLIDRFLADGRSGQLNSYQLFQAPL